MRSNFRENPSVASDRNMFCPVFVGPGEHWDVPHSQRGGGVSGEAGDGYLPSLVPWQQISPPQDEGNSFSEVKFYCETRELQLKVDMKKNKGFFCCFFRFNLSLRNNYIDRFAGSGISKISKVFVQIIIIIVLPVMMIEYVLCFLLTCDDKILNAILRWLTVPTED